MFGYQAKIPWNRVNEARDRINMAFSFIEPELMPLDFRVNGFNWNKITVRQRMLDHELALQERIAFINYQYEFFPDNDFIPILEVNTGEVVIPAALGAEFEYPDNEMPWCKGDPVISNIKEDVEKIQDINILESPLVKHAFERIELFLDYTDRKIPVTFFDTSSPLTIASKLMDSNTLFLSMYDNPDAMTHLLDVLADKTILLMKKQMEIIGNLDLLIPIMNTGISTRTKGVLYDDFNSMLSREMYKSICHNANGKILKAMGGGHLHSCGPVWHVIDEIIEIDGIHSFDFVFLKNKTKTTNDLLQVKDKCRNKVPFVSKSMPDFEKKGSLNYLNSSGDVAVNDEQNITPDWIKKMNSGGGFALRAAGTPEWGNELRSMITLAAK